MPRLFAGILLAGLFVALTWDFAVFWGEFQAFSRAAALGRDQVPTTPVPGEIIVVLTGDGGRIPRALDLLRSRPDSRLLISGAARGVNLTELVNQQGASMVDLGQIWSRIDVESASSSTVENAFFTARELGHPLPPQLILVTSDYHMSRSLSIYRRAFPQLPILPYAVASRPAASSLAYFWKTGAEYWKSVGYRVSLLF